jgi:hypothetical protein
MKPTISCRDQLLAEENYPNLVEFLRTGGKLEIGENHTTGSFACIRIRNQTVTVQCVYSDFAAVLAEMDAKAKRFLAWGGER